MENILCSMKSRSNIVLVLFWVFACNEAIKLIEERADKNRRYISMTELENKSEYYLKHRKRIGDLDEIKEKVKIMCDRFEELYREHGLDALHDLFAHEEDLELTLGKEDVWQNYIENMVYPRPPPESTFAKLFLASVAAIFIVAVVLATPFSFKYAKRFIKGFNYNVVDAEWKGAESREPVLVRRVKKRSRRVLYKPMLDRFDMKTESSGTSEAKLEEAVTNLKLRSRRDVQFAVKTKKEWNQISNQYKLDEIRRRKMEEDGDDEEDEDEWTAGVRKDQNEQVQSKKKVVDMKLKTFWNGQYRLKRRKKQ